MSRDAGGAEAGGAEAGGGNAGGDAGGDEAARGGEPSVRAGGDAFASSTTAAQAVQEDARAQANTKQERLARRQSGAGGAAGAPAAPTARRAAATSCASHSAGDVYAQAAVEAAAARAKSGGGQRRTGAGAAGGKDAARAARNFPRGVDKERGSSRGQEVASTCAATYEQTPVGLRLPSSTSGVARAKSTPKMAMASATCSRRQPAATPQTPAPAPAPASGPAPGPASTPVQQSPGAPVAQPPRPPPPQALENAAGTTSALASWHTPQGQERGKAPQTQVTAGRLLPSHASTHTSARLFAPYTPGADGVVHWSVASNQSPLSPETQQAHEPGRVDSASVSNERSLRMHTAHAHAHTLTPKPDTGSARGDCTPSRSTSSQLGRMQDADDPATDYYWDGRHDSVHAPSSTDEAEAHAGHAPPPVHFASALASGSSTACATGNAGAAAASERQRCMQLLGGSSSSSYLGGFESPEVPPRPATADGSRRASPSAPVEDDAGAELAAIAELATTIGGGDADSRSECGDRRLSRTADAMATPSMHAALSQIGEMIEADESSMLAAGETHATGVEVTRAHVALKPPPETATPLPPPRHYHHHEGRHERAASTEEAADVRASSPQTPAERTGYPLNRTDSLEDSRYEVTSPRSSPGWTPPTVLMRPMAPVRPPNCRARLSTAPCVLTIRTPARPQAPAPLEPRATPLPRHWRVPTAGASSSSSNGGRSLNSTGGGIALTPCCANHAHARLHSPDATGQWQQSPAPYVPPSAGGAGSAATEGGRRPTMARAQDVTPINPMLLPDAKRDSHAGSNAVDAEDYPWEPRRFDPSGTDDATTPTQAAAAVVPEAAGVAAAATMAAMAVARAGEEPSSLAPPVAGSDRASLAATMGPAAPPADEVSTAAIALLEQMDRDEIGGRVESSADAGMGVAGAGGGGDAMQAEADLKAYRRLATLCHAQGAALSVRGHAATLPVLLRPLRTFVAFTQEALQPGGTMATWAAADTSCAALSVISALVSPSPPLPPPPLLPPLASGDGGARAAGASAEQGPDEAARGLSTAHRLALDTWTSAVAMALPPLLEELSIAALSLLDSRTTAVATARPAADAADAAGATTPLPHASASLLRLVETALNLLVTPLGIRSPPAPAAPDDPASCAVLASRAADADVGADGFTLPAAPPLASAGAASWLYASLRLLFRLLPTLLSPTHAILHASTIRAATALFAAAASTTASVASAAERRMCLVAALPPLAPSSAVAGSRPMVPEVANGSLGGLGGRIELARRMQSTETLRPLCDALHTHPLATLHALSTLVHTPSDDDQPPADADAEAEAPLPSAAACAALCQVPPAPSAVVPHCFPTYLPRARSLCHLPPCPVRACLCLPARRAGVSSLQPPCVHRRGTVYARLSASSCLHTATVWPRGSLQRRYPPFASCCPPAAPSPPSPPPWRPTSPCREPSGPSCAPPRPRPSPASTPPRSTPPSGTPLQRAPPRTKAPMSALRPLPRPRCSRCSCTRCC